MSTITRYLVGAALAGLVALSMAAAGADTARAHASAYHLQACAGMIDREEVSTLTVGAHHPCTWGAELFLNQMLLARAQRRLPVSGWRGIAAVDSDFTVATANAVEAWTRTFAFPVRRYIGYEQMSALVWQCRAQVYGIRSDACF